MKLSFGVKTDPVEHRYTYEWLFDFLAEQGVRSVQLGSFFEMYSLKRDWFESLREKAETRGLRIASIFTAYRELGGFMSGDPAFEEVTYKNHIKLLEVGNALGVDYVGSNMGALYYDRSGYKATAIERYLAHIKGMTYLAKRHGLKALTIEPMSCLAEPPTLPEECTAIMRNLAEHHANNEDETVPVYFCSDISHGYADAERRVAADNWSLFTLQIPWMAEFHFKNTDAVFNSTFGFGPDDRARGIVDLSRLKKIIDDNADKFPVDEVVGYLELNNIKFGRDYTDTTLASYLRESIAVIKGVFGF